MPAPDSPSAPITERPVRVERLFHADGSLKEEIHYRGESCHGPWRQWHPNGVLAREWWYDRHVMADGTHRTWFPNGQLESEAVYRDGSLISEIAFNQRGQRVPTLLDRHFANERQWILKAAAKARAAVPAAGTPKRRRRKISVSDESNHHKLINHLLSTSNAPARRWLAESTEADQRTLGELNHEISCLVVETLHELGATEVLAVEICAEVQPGQSTNHLVITLPPDPDARARIMTFDRHYARKLGFASEGDWGQSHLYLLLC